MPLKESIRSMLAGGDLRSTGRASEVVTLIQQRPGKVVSLLKCLWDDDPCVSMRAAGATEKISRTQAALFQPHKAALLDLLAEVDQQEVRWHLALIMPRLQLSPTECQRIAELLQTYLDDTSSIVKTFALQGLCDLVSQDASLRPLVLDLLHSFSLSGTPAMRARCRILLSNWNQGTFIPRPEWQTVSAG